MQDKATKFHPILFSTPMVQAILDGRKTQTRRTKGLEKFNESPNSWRYDGFNEEDKTHYMELISSDRKPTEKYFEVVCTYDIGDVLWVRETFCKIPDFDYAYRASTDSDSEDIRQQYLNEGQTWAKWKPSLFMPKQACRIFLKVKSIRVERLQDIREEDAKKEGVVFENLWQQFDCYLCPTIKHKGTGLLCNDGFFNTAKESFSTLWESIFGHGTWEFNPYVFVYEYERIEKPLDFIV